MSTTTTAGEPPAGYDPSQFPAFAVTVDIVILTMSAGALHVLLVRRGEAPFEGKWAIPGGFKRPPETLDEAARRELVDETGVDVASQLTQFRAYGDPERDPRMNVVTVAYFAVLRDVGAIVAGTDAAEASLVPVSMVLDGDLDLAFDHLDIVRDAVERVGVDLDVTGLATAFVGTTFTLAELRAVYESVWGVRLDGANFRRSVVRGGRLGDPDRAPSPKRTRRRQARGALQSWTGVEPRRPDQAPRRRTMRAVVYEKYGPAEVLRIAEVERPVPEADEVLVKIHATTVTRTDTGLRSAQYFVSRFFTGLRRPKRTILGLELAGEVESVGADVTEFEVGDHVFGVKGSAHAEFVCVKESGPLAHKPAGMSFEEAAAVCDGASLALACLRKADLRDGSRVLVYGASGSVGTAGVQLAKSAGAHVTAVCNTKNVELVRSLGADVVVDYLKEDFTKNGETYDVVFDAVGMHSFRRCRHSLSPGGVYVSTDPGFMWHVPLLALLTKRIGKRKVAMGLTRYAKKDVLFLKELVEGGEYRAVIDRRYPLEDVIEASKYVETGQKVGNVVLTLNGARLTRTDVQA